MKLDGKVALVTGAGKGIGQGIALLFAKEGADIAIVGDVDLSAAEETAGKVREMGRRAIAIKADVAEANDVDMMVGNVLSNFGDIHILVNNAGIADQMVPTIESSIERWDKIVGVSLRGTFLCSRRVGQWMVSQKRGKILNLGSIVGIGGGFLFRTAYGPAKAGVMYLTRTLAVEWGKYNINVNCIAPGPVMTDMTKKVFEQEGVSPEAAKKRLPLGRFVEVDDIARAALFLVSDDANCITGVTLPVDGGWLA